ncbi:MAG: complex I subunit 1 family protein [Candidatus Margulisiibacteriota bacterium]
MLKLLFNYLIAPGLLFSSLVGLYATWVDRKVTAMVQYRKGSPWYQPFADILKLLGKETLVPENGALFLFISAPLFGLAAAALASTVLLEANGFIGDLIVVLYLFTVPSLMIMLGGSASGNPLSAIGTSREMKLILAYELPFIIAVFTAVLKSGSIVFSGITGYQSSHGMIILSLSGLIAFVVSLLVIQAKLGFVPFDIAEAEQELMAGPLLEYSGILLAVFKLTKAILYFALPVFLITIFMGGVVFSSLAGIIWSIIKYVLILVLIILIKNTSPRIKINQAVEFFWGPLTILAAVGFVLAVIGW